MRILSLFDGISCARVALERAGIPVEAYFASEIDKYATTISEKHYPDMFRLGDVKEVLYDAGQFLKSETPDYAHTMGVDFVEDIDLMIGGSPCQDLSIAKANRKGLAGERSGLFWEYVRILNQVKPKYFILENVASMPKEAKDLITKTLGVEPIMINAALVSAQNRKRLFWVGKFKQQSNGWLYEKVEIPQPEDKGIMLKDILLDGSTEDLKSLCITASYHKKNKQNFLKKRDGQMIQTGNIGTNAQAHRVYDPAGKSVTLSALGGGQGAKTGLYLIEDKLVIKEATKKGYAEINEGDSVDVSFPTSETRRGRVGNKAKNLMTSSSIGVLQGGILRKLHPIECERLQGLPDNYTEGLSNTQRYKTLGNAFNVDVVAHILSFIV